MITFHPCHGDSGIHTVYQIVVDGEVRGVIYHSPLDHYVVRLDDHRDAQGDARLTVNESGPLIGGMLPGSLPGFATLDDAMACALALFDDAPQGDTPIPARADSRVASRVPSASASVVIPIPFPTSTGAAFYSQALTRPLLDAQRDSHTPTTRNTQ